MRHLTSLCKRILDQLVMLWAATWVFAHAPQEWARLVKHQWRAGAYRIRLAVPLLANEKYHWRKMFDHNPLFVTVSDKQSCKEWVASLGLGFETAETLWIGTDASLIPDDVWAQPMLIKPTHGSGMNVSVPDGPRDKAAKIERANGYLQKDHGVRWHEWSYTQIDRRLICERWAFPGANLVEYKCYAFGDQINQIVVIYRGENPSASIWHPDENGEFLLSDEVSAVADIIDQRALGDAAFRAIAISTQLGSHFDHIRVDFLSDSVQLLLGELTVYNLAGRAHLQGHLVDAPLNRSWDLRKSWFLTTPQPGWRGLYAAALRRALDRRDKSKVVRRLGA